MQGPNIFDLQALINQQQMEIDLNKTLNGDLVEEVNKLKAKIVNMNKEKIEMNSLVQSIKTTSNKKMLNFKLLFLSEKGKLIEIINDLKTRLNNMNREVDEEVRVRDLLLCREQKTTHKLR